VSQVRFTPFGRTIECAEGEPILSAALSRGYFLRYGCKHGGCGTCKVLVTDGDLEDSGSSFALTRADRSAGWALACSSRPLSDCVIDISAMGLTEDEFLAGDQVETFETVIGSSKIQFTPQKKFFDTTQNWAVALQDIYGGDDAASRLRSLAKTNTSKVNL